MFFVNRRGCLKAAAFLPAVAIPLGCAGSGGQEPGTPALPSPTDLPRRAVRLFVEENRGCAGAVLMAVCEGIGFQGGPFLDMALELSGRVGLQGRTCGCVNAGGFREVQEGSERGGVRQGPGEGVPDPGRDAAEVLTPGRNGGRVEERADVTGG